jgi:hypothetical protein
MVVTWQNIPAHLAAQAEDAQRGTIGVDQSALNEPSSRVHQGTVRYIAGQEEVSQGGVTRHAVSFDGVQGGSVLASLQRINGADTVELIPGVPASRTQIAHAVRDNLIRQIAPGVYEDVRSSDGTQRTLEHVEAEQQAGQQQQQAERAEYVDPQEEADWAADIADMPQVAYDVASASAIGAILRKDGFADTAKSLAQNANISPELATQYVEEGFAKGRRMVDRALAPMGLSGDRLAAFYQAAGERPHELQDAMQRLWWQNDASGFKAMAVAWKVANPGDLSVFHKAGFETHVDRDTGDVMVKRGSGPWVKTSALGK